MERIAVQEIRPLLHRLRKWKFTGTQISCFFYCCLILRFFLSLSLCFSRFVANSNEIPFIIFDYLLCQLQSPRQSTFHFNMNVSCFRWLEKLDIIGYTTTRCVSLKSDQIQQFELLEQNFSNQLVLFPTLKWLAINCKWNSIPSISNYWIWLFLSCTDLSCFVLVCFITKWQIFKREVFFSFSFETYQTFTHSLCVEIWIGFGKRKKKKWKRLFPSSKSSVPGWDWSLWFNVTKNAILQPTSHYLLQS